MRRARAYAKINLGLVVGQVHGDGKHEILTVLQRVDVHDDVELEPSDDLTVEGFAEDTIVRSALESLAVVARVEPRWRVRLEKRIPVAAGLRGEAATPPQPAARERRAVEPLDPRAMHEVAATVGRMLPSSPCGNAGRGRWDRGPQSSPLDYHFGLVVPTRGELSTAFVYQASTNAAGAALPERAVAFHALSTRSGTLRDLGRSRERFASSAISRESRRCRCFRATGREPARCYGLFDQCPRRPSGRRGARPRRADDRHAAAPRGRSRVNGKMSAAQWAFCKR